MEQIFNRRNAFSTKALFTFSNLNKGSQEHLQRVYTALAATMLTSGIGAALYFIVPFGILGSIGALVMFFWLMFTPMDYNLSRPQQLDLQKKRLGLLCGFGFFTGLSLGPLLDFVIDINPQIVPTAFLTTSVLFVSLTLTALWTDKRSWLYLGGTLFSGISMLLLMGFMNFFLRSVFIFEIQLWLGLLIFCGFVLFDTQLIIYRFENGDHDYVWHALDLFIDFIDIFRRILVILAKKEKSKK
jgi:FtsH-binding integral membrane protein